MNLWCNRDEQGEVVVKSQGHSVSFYFVAAALLGATAFFVACSESDPPDARGGECYRCLDGDPYAIECSETVDTARTDGVRACIDGDDVELCSTLSQCCRALRLETTAAGSCVFPEGDAIEFIRIDGGIFQMGGDGGGLNPRLSCDGYPIHPVSIPSFEMSKTEVTVGQYRQCVSAGTCTRASDPALYSPPGEKENHPVTRVSWDQAKVFAEFAGARLPTEAEWEYAAKSGGQDIIYPWGNEDPDCNRSNSGDCEDDTTPVCSYATGNTAQGLCDMAGNVTEWVEDDWHINYEGAPDDGSAWVEFPRISDGRRVYRGELRAACRFTIAGNYPFDGIGFRLARSAP